MDLEWAFFDFEGALLHSLLKVGGHDPSGPLGSCVPALENEASA